MKRNLILTLVFLLLFTTPLAACNQPEPELTVELIPTAKPTVPPEPTTPSNPTAEPTAPPEPTPTAAVAELEDPLYLSIFWHHHQPIYFKDPETDIYQKPWVRLHATKDYVDMAAILEQYPEIQVAFNLTPSLLRQLIDLESGTKDLYQVHTEISAAELTDDQKTFIESRFFDVNPKIIARFPRFQEIANDRGNRAELG